jgi:hypothetical protein
MTCQGMELLERGKMIIINIYWVKMYLVIAKHFMCANSALSNTHGADIIGNSI